MNWLVIKRLVQLAMELWVSGLNHFDVIFPIVFMLFLLSGAANTVRSLETTILSVRTPRAMILRVRTMGNPYWDY